MFKYTPPFWLRVGLRNVPTLFLCAMKVHVH
jgi:hypothetical protein